MIEKLQESEAPDISFSARSAADERDISIGSGCQEVFCVFFCQEGKSLKLFLVSQESNWAVEKLFFSARCAVFVFKQWI